MAEAGQNSVILPQHFSMDFEKYQTSPPAVEAAGPLGRQLAALKIVMDILINEQVDAVIGLERTPLPQEGVAGSRSERGRFGRGAGENAGGGGTSGGLVEKYPFEIRFTANQPAFQKVLNDFAASSKQFFITRMLLIENSDPKPVDQTTRRDSHADGGPARGRRVRHAISGDKRRGGRRFAGDFGRRVSEIHSGHGKAECGHADRHGCVQSAGKIESQGNGAGPPTAMNWIKHNYDQFILALVALILLVLSAS